MSFRPGRFLAAVFLVPAGLLTLFCVWAVAVRGSMPAPRLSGSDAFNEKARWLRTHLQTRCDVLVIGSSMALYDADGAELQRSFPSQVIVNTGSWGLSLKDSAKVLGDVSRRCHPRSIVLFTYFGDFFNGNNDIGADWEQFARYVGGGPALLSYLSAPDLLYYVFARHRLREIRFRGDLSYDSLQFDDTGGVGLACSNFPIDPKRWEGYRAMTNAVTGLPQDQLEALNAIGALARKLDSQFLVVSVPMRRAAEEFVHPPVLKSLWEQVRVRVEAQQGRFLQIPSTEGFPDSMFVDFSHLNECGARQLTRVVAASMPPPPAPAS